MAAVVLTIARGSLEVLRTLSANRGDVIILISQMLWVTYTLYTRANRSTFSPLQMLAGAHVVAAGLLLPLALLERPWQSFAGASWVAVVVVLYSSLLGTPAHIAFYQAVRTVGPGRAAVFTNLDPVPGAGAVLADGGRADPLVPLDRRLRRDRGRGADNYKSRPSSSPSPLRGEGRVRGGLSLSYRLAEAFGLAGATFAGLSSLMRCFTSSMNWEMSLNWRYTEANRT